MKQEILSAAIDAARMLKMMVVVARFRKDSVKEASRLRARLDNHVVLLSTMTQENPLYDSAEAFVRSLQENLLSYLQAFELDSVVAALEAGERRAAFVRLCKGPEIKVRDAHSALNLLQLNPPVVRDAGTNVGGARVRNQKEYLSIFARLVRNAPWAALLLKLAPKAPVSAVADFERRLLSLQGSRPGQLQVPVWMSKFCPDALPAAADVDAGTAPVKKKGGVRIAWKSGPFSVYVALSLEKLRENSNFTELVAELGFLGKGAEAAKLLEASKTPVLVPEGTDPKVVAQSALNELVAQLKELRKQAQAEKQAALVKAEQEKKAKALEALKSLGPLAQVIRDNPELLNQL